MNRQPRPIVDVLITTPNGTVSSPRFVFDLPVGYDRGKRGLFVKIGHAAIRVTPRDIKRGRVTVHHTQLVNVPAKSHLYSSVPLRKVQ